MNQQQRLVVRDIMEQQRQAAQGGARITDHLVSQIVDPHEADESSALMDGVDHVLLEEFKNQVKMWWELDTAVKRLQAAIKERKKMQLHLNDKILNFMKQYNIEDLNTKDGVLRYKTSFVKTPLSQKTIKTKLCEFFERDEHAKEIVRKIFEEREKVQKVSLRRINI
jgi:hypothetical protein